MVAFMACAAAVLLGGRWAGSRRSGGWARCGAARRHGMLAAQLAVEPSRLHHLTLAPRPVTAAAATPFVLYWMQNSVRATHSPALEHAAQLAAQLGVPLRAVHTFDPVAQDGRPLPIRHAYFLLETLADVQDTLVNQRNISLVVAEPTCAAHIAIQKLVHSGAAAVITDVSYLRRGRQVRQQAAETMPHVHLVAVEGDVVVPVHEATGKLEHAARTIRPKIHRRMDAFIENPTPQVTLPAQAGECMDGGAWVTAASLVALELGDLDEAVSRIESQLDRGVPRVPSKIIMGGEGAAQYVLHEFLEHKLEQYAVLRNEPAKEFQSNLSPYLRIGAISPVDIARQTRKRVAILASAAAEEGAAIFLEELIVRRELAVNMCWFDPNGYDQYAQTVPPFAQQTLELHQADARPVIHTYDELEKGQTADEFWNAAQRELVASGRMHGYMRMFWGKRVLMWTENAETALEYCLRLNNRWGLDAVDASSYAGVAWIFGRHDRGWPERTIYGKVRFMNESGLRRRKLKMDGYLSRVSALELVPGAEEEEWAES